MRFKLLFLLVLLFTVNYTEQDVLSSLDKEEVGFKRLFPQLDNPLQYPVASRIHLYSNQKSWAVVFEVVAYDATGFTCSINNYYFGNCIDYDKIKKSSGGQIENLTYKTLLSNKQINELDKIAEGAVFDNTISIGEKKYTVERDISEYKKHNIIGLYFEKTEKKIDVLSALRLMEIKYPDLFKDSESHLTQFLKDKTLKKIITIDKWHHKNYLFNPFTKKMKGDKPGSYETFQQIAKVLVTSDAKNWKPTLKPNNHWSNWPEAGNY